MGNTINSAYQQSNLAPNTSQVTVGFAWSGSYCGPQAKWVGILAGGDIWMLHAWVVPGHPDSDGRFATFNQTLCPSYIGTADISRCPD